MPERMFVASGHGTSMVFRVNAKQKVFWASPRCPAVRGRHVRIVRDIMHAKGFAFYEVTRGSNT